MLVHTTLIRDGAGLGFSIAGGKGSPPYRDDSDAIYISRISPQGAAAKDGKMQVGDKVVSVSIYHRAKFTSNYSLSPGFFPKLGWG